jgi:two-component system, OmpR family, sensor histidine kinase ChvG
MDFAVSKTTRHLDIDGLAPSTTDDQARQFHQLTRRLRRYTSSLTVKFVVLIAIFLVLPLLLYSQYDRADSDLRKLVIRGIEHQSNLVAQALRPMLDRPDKLPDTAMLNAELAKYNDDGTSLHLMLQPASRGAATNFYFLAASPAIQADQLDAELGSLRENGVLDRLSRSCDGDTPLDLQYTRPGERDKILTTLIPIRTRWGCWSLVSSHTTAEYLYTWIARPFWATPESQIAAGVYLAAAFVVLLVVGGVTRSLRHFRRVATAIREGRTQNFTFVSRNVVPELGSVAADFDALALDLRNVARDIRRAAEDNAHSFKSPVATIEASVETARRSLQASDQTAVRAFDLIVISIERLKALISASQQLDNITADLIEAPRSRIDLGGVVGGVLDRFDDLMIEQDITLARSMKDKVSINGSLEILEIAIENIVDNAISFAPRGSTITVTLNKSAQFADLFIDDEGPGIEPQKLAYIFDRYFSLRPAAANDDVLVGAPHAGLGLWIVRRNIEALGGTVTATNLPNSGLRLHIILPLSSKKG